jgi:hypothetical protein
MSRSVAGQCCRSARVIVGGGLGIRCYTLMMYVIAANGGIWSTLADPVELVAPVPAELVAAAPFVEVQPVPAASVDPLPPCTSV